MGVVGVVGVGQGKEALLQEAPPAPVGPGEGTRSWSWGLSQDLASSRGEGAGGWVGRGASL